MTATSVQNQYRRNMNEFVAGQIADGRDCQIDTGRFIVNSTYTIPTLPFGYAVGLVDNPVADANGSSLLSGYACARNYTTSGSGTSTVCTNFGGIAVRNVALPGSGTQVQGAASGTNRVLDAYNQNDLVSIGSEGDFVVVCAADVSARNPVYVSTASGNTLGQFYGSANATGRASVAGAIFLTDSKNVFPYNTDTSVASNAVKLAVVRIRLQPR